MKRQEPEKEFQAEAVSRLRPGCYLLRYTPVATMLQGKTRQYEGNEFRSHFDGTFRVSRQENSTALKASGDLYYHAPPSKADFNDPDIEWDWPLFEPNPSQIPIFPIDAYRFYVHVIQLKERQNPEDCIELRFELHEWVKDLEESESFRDRFENRGCCFATFRWSRAPRDLPSAEDFLTGEVRDAADTVIGFMTLGWLSDYLRRAVVEIDRVSESEPALNNGCHEDWKSVFSKAGWDVTVEESDDIIPEPSGESWSDAELHDAMLAWRTQFEVLGRAWRYHLMCVRRLDSTERGIMYDRRALDSNNVPREGAAISSHWVIPDQASWGKVRGLRFGAAAAPYFRTAVHEIGHAFCLVHNISGFHFMRATQGISNQASNVGVEFPDNIDWSFSTEDTYWIQHAPDLFLRPGGIPFAELIDFLYEFEDSNHRTPAKDLSLNVEPLNTSLPLGAPVRVHVKLTNTGASTARVPESIGFKSGSVRGRVIDEAGAVREFRPLVICVDNHPLTDLAAGKSLEKSFTLFRGPQGALFPRPGKYRVEFDIAWHEELVRAAVYGSCEVTVTNPRNARHEAAARHVLGTPDALLTLVLAGDHLPEGREAIKTALSNSVLRVHYACIEARRLARRFRDRPADIQAAAEVLGDSAIMTPSEIRRLASLATDSAEAEPKDQILGQLRNLAESVKCSHRPIESLQ